MNILVTGASRGIGYELVKKFAQAGNSNILAISRNQNKLEELAKECKLLNPLANIIPLSFDLSNIEKFDTIINTIEQKLKSKVDILINNAASFINKNFADISVNDIGHIYKANVFAPFFLIQKSLPYFQKHSHIVNISSMGGFQGSQKFPGLSIYSSSKAALANLTECLAEELKPLEIKINCLCLGAVQTQMLQEAFPNFKAPVSAIEMANFICDFALNAHKHQNGKVIPVSTSTP